MGWLFRLRRYAALPLVALVLALLGTTKPQPPAAPKPLLQLGSPAFRHAGFDFESTTFLAFTKDGKELVTVSEADTEVRYWDVATGKRLREVPLRAEGVLVGVDLSPDGKWLATAEWLTEKANRAVHRRVARLRNAATGEVVRSRECGLVERFTSFSVAFLPGRNEIAVMFSRLQPDEVSLTVWDHATGKEMTPDLGLKTVPRSGFTFTPDGKRGVELTGPENDLLLWTWDGKPPTHIATGLKGNYGPIHASPDGVTFATHAPGEPSIELIDARTGKPIRRLRLGDDQRDFGQIRFTPDGKHLLAVEGSGSWTAWRPNRGQVVVWEVATGRLVSRWPTPATVGPLVLSPDGGLVAMHSPGLPTWHLPTGKAVRPLIEADTLIAHQVSCQGGFFLTLSPHGPAQLWEERTGRILHTLHHPNAFARAGVIHPDGNLVATADGDGVILVWDARTGTARFRLAGHGEEDRLTAPLALRFSPDGKALYSFGGDFALRKTDLTSLKPVGEWDVLMRDTPLQDRQLTRHLQGRRLPPSIAALSADGSRLAFGLQFNRQLLHVFDTTAGQPLGRVDLGSNPTCEPVFSSDGRRLLTLAFAPWEGGPEGRFDLDGPRLQCWDLASGEVLWMHYLPDQFDLLASDDRTLATASSRQGRGPVEFRSLDDGRLLTKLDNLPGPPRHLAYLPDGKSLAVALPDGSVQVHAVPAMKPEP